MYAAILGPRFCITRSLGGLGIGCLNALHCLTNGAVVSGGFLLFQNYMLKFDCFFPFYFLSSSSLNFCVAPLSTLFWNNVI